MVCTSIGMMITVIVLGLSIYFRNQGRGIYESREEAIMILWLIGIVASPIAYIVYRLKRKKFMEKEKKEIND